MKKILIIANWKMNPTTLAETKKLFAAVKKLDTVICPPVYFLNSKILPSGAKFKLGAQNCHWEEKGAFTGEISPKTLKELGGEYVIIGHSERRAYFQETDGMINKKIKAALKFGLIPILCIGEKENEDAKLIVEKQLSEGLKGIADNEIKKIIIAYEPVWAIGTGSFCDPEKAKNILDLIKRKTGNEVLYGGSVNSEISGSYLKIGFNGLLVGGASLDAEEFIKIIENAKN